MKRLRTLSVHTKIFIGWGFCIVGGVCGFIASRRYITSRRYESMKSRERIRNALNDVSSNTQLERHSK